MAESRVGFPVLKHTVLLRLLIGHVGEPERIRTMLEEYVAELAVARADLREVRDSLRGADEPGEAFHYPSVVADWGLDYFAAEARHTRQALERLLRRLGGTVTSRTLYSCTMSLDGFMAGPGGDMQWLKQYVGPNQVADDLVPRVGSLLVGARTFGGDDPNRGTDSEGAFGGRWHGPSFVLTHPPPASRCPTTPFVTDLEEAVAAARAAAGGLYVNILGADVARQCLAAGLLDEVLVLVVPVLLGDGTRLFDWPGGRSVDLRLQRVLRARRHRQPLVRRRPLTPSRRKESATTRRVGVLCARS